jgi:threonine dehydratase
LLCELCGKKFRGGALISKADIEKAYARIHDQIVRTPLVYSQKLSYLCGCQTYCKLENLQMTGSFKERGALNKLSALSLSERSRGVIAASAGNHAQAVAYHCQRLGIKAKIIMPKGTPLIKVVSTQGYGAEVVLHGETVDDASDLALEISRKEGSLFLHPFNDPEVIAGQGTIAREILEDEQGRTLDAVICPVGGGGLISGIATYLKETAPRIAVIGVQAAACPSMKKSLEAGHPIRLERASSLADGITIKRVEPLNFFMIRKYVDEIVTVDEDQIANAVLLLLEMEKIVSEGAGAVALAAVLNRKVNLLGQKVLLIISGGNIDVNILDKIITRGLAVAGRVAQLILRVQDLPGSLMAVLEIIKKLQVNILDIKHHRFDSTAPFGYVDVAFTLETKGHTHIEEIKKALRESGYHPQSCLLSD